jgi:hypothetical protein
MFRWIEPVKIRELTTIEGAANDLGPETGPRIRRAGFAFVPRSH